MLVRSVRGSIAAAGAVASGPTPIARAASAFMGDMAVDVRIPVLLGVTDQDTPLDNLQVVAVTQATDGVFAVTAGGRLVTYARGSAGIDTYTGTYTVRDPQGNEDTEIVSVIVANEPASEFADGSQWTDGTNWVV